MDCYSCKHRRDLPGSCHSACHAVGNNPNSLVVVTIAVFRAGTNGNYTYGNISFEPHGVNNGWCMWPSNFDPIWVRHCNYYEGK